MGAAMVTNRKGMRKRSFLCCREFVKKESSGRRNKRGLRNHGSLRCRSLRSRGESKWKTAGYN